jgi:hypothetical protein
MKTSARIFASFVLIAFFLMLAAGSTGNDEEADRAIDEAPKVIEEEPEEYEVDIEVLEQLVLNLLVENMGDVAEIEFVKEEETFYITPTAPSFVLEVMDAVEGQAYAVEGWEGLVESKIGLSKSIEELLPGYWLSLRNPVNPELSLLIVSDGFVLYDFLKDE